MPRRVQSKSNLPKKPAGGDKYAPPPEQWAEMKQFTSFIVYDDDGKENRFSQGQSATVLPFNRKPDEKLELHEYWVGEIKEIRAVDFGDEDRANEVWVRVQWYYSPRDVSNAVKSFDAKSCGKYERIISDHFDLVTSQAFNDIVPVLKLCETWDQDTQQTFIQKEQFYYRYTFDYTAKTIDPNPGTNTCICNLPYKPDDPASLMHFCPRPSCKKAYHQKCLVKGKHKDTESASTRPLRLLACSPDTSTPITLEDLIPREPPKKKRRGRPSKSSTLHPLEDGVSVESILSSLPDPLVQYAQQPMVRGAAFPAGGVAGNINAVIVARRLVHTALGGTPVPENWKEAVFGFEDATAGPIPNPIVRVTGKQVVPALICPQCHSCI